MSDRSESRRPDGVRLLLAANLVLTGALAWAHFADTPLAASEAHATAAQPNFPNASAQRQAIVKAVQDLKKSVDGLGSSLERGKLRVEVTNAKEIADAIDSDGG